MHPFQNQEIEGVEKQRYLHHLLRGISTLRAGLAAARDEQHIETIRTFAKEKNWDWDRLPAEQNTYEQLGVMLGHAYKQLSLFDRITDSKDPQENMGYFSKLTISSESGFPWTYDTVELHRLKKEAPNILARTPTYANLVENVRGELMHDAVDVEVLPIVIEALYEQALKRNFLESLMKSDLLKWNENYSLAPVVSRTRTLGSEELWNISFLRFAKDSGMYHMYAIDAWQDNLGEKQVTDRGISQELSSTLSFSHEVAAWYILKQIDERFENLHPVHVSRGLLGPFESRYVTRPSVIPLAATGELLKQDKNAALLRFSRQYSYAPNHVAGKENTIRQTIYREDWRDEIIVAPAAYSGMVARSVQGENVRILEM